MKKAYAACCALMALTLLAGCGGGADTAAATGSKLQQRRAGPVAAAAASDYSTAVQQLYIAYFGRPADTSGLSNFSAQLAAIGAPSDIQGLVAAYATNPTIHALIDSFGTSAESNALYTGDTTSFVTAIYKNVLNRTPDAAGLAFWVNAIDNGGLSKGNASLSIMAGALTNTSSQGLIDAQIVSNKVTVASQFTSSLDTSSKISSYSGDTAAATARNMLGVVSNSTDTNAFQANINATLDTLAAVTNTGTPVVSLSPSKLVQSFTAGSSVTFSINATVNNVQNFIGASVIYIYIVDNVGVITTNVGISANSSTSYTATFHSSPSLPAGTYKGNLALKVCRDSTCSSQFPGSPVAIPYEITATGSSTSGQTTTTPVTPNFQLGSSAVTFSAVNGAPIASQNVSISSSTSTAIAWSAASDAAWLTASPASGTTPGSISLSADPGAAALASGSYTANLNLTAPGVTGKTLPVKLTLTKPTLSASSSALIFGGSNGRSFSSSAVTLSLNTSTNSWSWSLSGLPSWLTSSLSSGTVNQTGTSVSLTPNAKNASVGTSSATVTATAKVNGDTVTAPLTVTINKDQHRLVASDAGVAFASTPNWSNVSRTLTVSDNFGQATGWTATSDQSWLTVTPSGTTGSNGSTLTLSANPASLSSDTVNYATVTISATTDTTVTSTEQVRVALWKGSSTPSAITKLSQSYNRVIADPIRPYAYVHANGTSIDVYNMYTASKIGTFSSVGSALGDMSISPDGDRLYVLDTPNKTLKVIDLKNWSGTPVATWTLANAVSSSSTVKAIRPNGVTVVLVGDGTSYLASTGKQLSSTGIYGVMTATSDGKQVFTQDQGYSPASVASYSVDYSEVGGGTLAVSLLKSGSFINSSSNGRDIAVSGDGTHLYTATGAPYRCTSVQPSTLTAVGSLPGGDAYPNAVKIGVDGRVYCGISGWYSSADVWVHNSSGTQLASYKFAGYARALLDRQLGVSGDGLMLVALTDDPRLVFIPVGP